MIIKYSIKNYKEYKNKLLKIIDSMPNIGAEQDYIKNCGTSVSKSDWLLNRDVIKPYADLFFEMVKPFIVFVEEQYSAKLKINNFWFQQYHKNDYHNWHTHPHTHFSNVFYLELPKGNPGTEFLAYDSKKNKELDLKEGDILSFPAFMAHKSPEIKTNKRKTVIVFNTTLYHVKV